MKGISITVRSAGTGHLGCSTGHRSSVAILVALLLLPVTIAEEEQDLVEFTETFQWYGTKIEINFSRSLSTFIYSSAAWPPGRHVYDCDAFFLYYEVDLIRSLADLLGTLNSSAVDIYVILDPDPPAPGMTFLDLYYDRALRTDMIDYINSIIADLTDLGVLGFVIGDEWPRGLNNVEITPDLLSSYNHTYHAESGLWMRPDPDADERLSLVEWFYNRSISAWNMIAREVRDRNPDARMGTNIDLVWRGDLSHTNLAHWKPGDWWKQVDLDPYDFVVTHYFTSVKWEDDFPTPPSHVDAEGSQVLRESLEELQRYFSGFEGPEVFLLLGAHCVYPRAKTPMQMVHEWNLAMEFNDFLSGVGWFIFDLWKSNDGKSIESFSIADTIIRTPMKMDRLATLKVLLENPLRRADTPPGGPGNIEIVWMKTYSPDYLKIHGFARSSDSCLVVTTVQLCSGCEEKIQLLSIGDNGSVNWFHVLDYEGSPTSVIGGHGGSYLIAGINNASNYFIIKLNQIGKIIWETVLEYEYGTPRIIRTPWGYAVSCGSRISCLDGDGDVTWHRDLDPLSITCLFFPGDGDLILAGRSSDTAFILRMSPGGKQLWCKYLGDWWPLDITECPDGFLISGGETRICGLGCCWLGLFIANLDHDGKEQWNHTLGLWVTDSCRAISRGEGEYAIIWGEGICSVLLNGPNLSVKNLGAGKFLAGGMVEAEDGGLMLAGIYPGLDAGLRIIKLDQGYSALWDCMYESRVESCRVIPDHGGRYLIAGTSYTSPGSSHAHLLKLEGDGCPVWERAYPGPGSDVTGAAMECNGGGSALAGVYGSELDGGVYLLRADSAGNLLWVARHGIEGVVDVCSVIQGGEGDFILSGTLSGISGSDAFIVCILPSGELGWQETFDSGVEDHANWLFQGNGCYYLVGDAVSGGDGNILLIRVDYSGGSNWTMTYGGDGTDSGTYGLLDGSTAVVAGRGELMGHEGPYLVGIDDGGMEIFDRTYQWDGGTIREMAPRPNGGFCAIGRGGSLLKLDEDWDRVWDTGWEPVGPEASIFSYGDGYHLIAGSLSGKIRAVKILEPVVERPDCFLLTVIILALLTMGQWISQRTVATLPR